MCQSSSEEGSAECPPPGSPSPLHFDLISYFQLQDFPHVCKTSWPISPPALGETLNLKMKIRGPFAPGEIRHKQAWGEPLGQRCFSRLVTVTHSRMPPPTGYPFSPSSSGRLAWPPARPDKRGVKSGSWGRGMAEETTLTFHLDGASLFFFHPLAKLPEKLLVSNSTPFLPALLGDLYTLNRRGGVASAPASLSRGRQRCSCGLFLSKHLLKPVF